MENFEPVMSVEEYKKIFELISDMSYDIEGFKAYQPLTDDEKEKYKWVFAIRDVLEDIPLRYAEWAVHKKYLVYDHREFMDAYYEECKKSRLMQYQ